jgi:hypothetical protein
MTGPANAMNAMSGLRTLNMEIAAADTLRTSK